MNRKCHVNFSFSYRISPPISSGLIRVRKALMMGLSAGGLIAGGAYMRVKKKGKWDERHHKTE